MIKLKSTPGPWTIIQHNANPAGILTVVGDTKNGRDHLLDIDVTGSPEREANAQLILAAPDLYDALAELLDKASVFVAAPGTPLDKAYDKAVKAMKKAEGYIVEGRRLVVDGK